MTHARSLATRGRSLGSRAFAVLLALCGVACGPEPTICDAPGLEEALAEAEPGDVVRIGACTIEGAFVLPDQVTLAGTGASVLASVDARPIVRTSGASGATVRGLRLEVDHAGVGIRAAGGGTLEVLDVDVVVSRGIGVGLDGSGATLERVTLRGPIDPATALTARSSPTETGTFGLVGRALGTRVVTLSEVRVESFAVAGVAISGGIFFWTGSGEGPDVEGVRGVGLALFDADAMLQDLEITAMRSGPGMRGVGVAVARSASGSASLAASSLSVHDGEGYGLFSDGAEITLSGVSISDLSAPGLCAQGGTLEVANLLVQRVGGAGILAIDAERVEVRGARLDETREALFVSAGGSVTIADGIEVVRDPLEPDAPPLDLSLRNVTMVDNARAGALVDAADGPVTRVELVSVAVDTTGFAYGVIAQRTALDPDWDARVTRTGTAAVNDASLGVLLEVAGHLSSPGALAAPPAF